MSDLRADEVVINGRKRLKVQTSIAYLLGVLVAIVAFLGAYMLLYLDRHNDSRYVSIEIYKQEQQTALAFHKQEIEDAQKLHDAEMSKWEVQFSEFKSTQDEMRGDIKSLLKLPTAVTNLERRIRYANEKDHPTEIPGGIINDPPKPQ